jgi:hypothetical protein
MGELQSAEADNGFSSKIAFKKTLRILFDRQAGSEFAHHGPG